jgi:mRNA interferase RelE/StbE
VKTVRYVHDAQAALRQQGNVADRLRRAIREYAENPAAHANTVTQLVGQPAKRMRVGDYRIVFEETDMKLVVTKIGSCG